MNNFVSNVATWHVLHSKPRCEKKLDEFLGALIIEKYLPLRSEIKIYQRRKVFIEKPLFPSYMFACFPPDKRIAVLQSRMLVRILPVYDQAGLVNNLRQIKLALADNPYIKAASILSKGDRVRITSGPLQGVEGIVNVLKGATRVFLLVESIGQGVAVEVDPASLERT